LRAEDLLEQQKKKLDGVKINGRSLEKLSAGFKRPRRTLRIR